MKQRGRPGGGNLTIIGPSGIETVERPPAPDELTAEQRAEWRAIVNRLPADWFPRETHPMLAQLCRHIDMARYVAEMIAGMRGDPDGFDPMMLARWTRMQANESLLIATLSTKLRISQQATIKNASAKKPVVAKPPWQR